jgi:hypothetical protein
MAAASSSRDRIEALAILASELHGETRLLARADAPEELWALARLYEQVVREVTEKHVRDLPAAEHGQVLVPLAGRLAWAEAEAERLAREVPEASAGPLLDIAAAAHDGDQRLCALLHREKSAPLPPDGEGASVSAPAPAERLRLFRRNRGLIEKVVQSGLLLAAERDPLRCAQCCADLAESLAIEIKDAAHSKEGSRVAELGQHLRDLLKQGVAANVTTVRSQVEKAPPDSSLRKDFAKLQRVHDQTTQVLQRLDRDLQRVVDPGDREAERARNAVQEGRTEVERAMKGPGTVRGKDKN